MGLLKSAVGHALNFASHKAQESGHRDVSGAIDGLIQGSNRYVDQSVADRRWDRARADVKIRLMVQQDE
ncbi:MAG: hypothetical protein NTU94_00160 [Planctomycetota bacterium]|nr:hypothetical protein [Planctomycetota bacterium]